MKNLLLAAAAVMTLGVGSAFADGDVTAQPAASARPVQTQSGTVDRSGIYVTNTPRHEVWVYGAMRSPGNPQGGQN